MVVVVSYRLYDSMNVLRDSTRKGSPVRYVHGFAQIVPGLERGLIGAFPGDQRTIDLGPDEAFGERDEGAVLEIERQSLPSAVNVKVGDEVLAAGPDGDEFSYSVTSVDGDVIRADMNHPLAGQRVRFEAEVLSVRPATDAEVEEALLEVDERIVGDDTIDYGTGDAGRDAGASEPHAATLVQLTKKPRHESGPS